MTVSISDLLHLPLFSEAIVLTGKNGLNREIKRINFDDCPEDPTVDQQLTMPGDFYINSLYLVKDDPKALENVFDFHLQTNSAGMCLINEYFQDLPQKIKTKLNKHNFPVILVDKNVQYAEIISKVSELIFLEKNDTISKLVIDQLLNPDLSSQQVLELGANINSGFRKNYACIFISHQSDSEDALKFIRNELCNNHKLHVNKYGRSLLVIVNFDDRIIYDSACLYIKKVLIKHGLNYKMGISSIYKKKTELHLCIQEGLSAFEYCQEINSNQVQYSDVEVYKLLLSINNTEKLKGYYQKYIAPLQTKDSNDLLTTIETFIEFDGDYKKTAKYFDQHENTVRYRITKAKKKLKMEQYHLKFIEMVSLGIKIKHIFQDMEEKTD